MSLEFKYIPLPSPEGTKIPSAYNYVTQVLGLSPPAKKSELKKDEKPKAQAKPAKEEREKISWLGGKISTTKTSGVMAFNSKS